MADRLDHFFDIGVHIMRCQITVFADEITVWPPRKEGQAPAISHVLQCLVHGDNQLVGELKFGHALVDGKHIAVEKTQAFLNSFEHSAKSYGDDIKQRAQGLAIPPGEYYVDWGMVRDYQTKEIKSRIVELVTFAEVMGRGDAKKDQSKAA